jgi:hypothetical protein
MKTSSGIFHDWNVRYHSYQIKLYLIFETIIDDFNLFLFYCRDLLKCGESALKIKNRRT